MRAKILTKKKSSEGKNILLPFKEFNRNNDIFLRRNSHNIFIENMWPIGFMSSICGLFYKFIHLRMYLELCLKNLGVLVFLRRVISICQIKCKIIK